MLKYIFPIRSYILTGNLQSKHPNFIADFIPITNQLTHFYVIISTYELVEVHLPTYIRQ